MTYFVAHTGALRGLTPWSGPHATLAEAERSACDGARQIGSDLEVRETLDDGTSRGVGRTEKVSPVGYAVRPYADEGV